MGITGISTASTSISFRAFLRFKIEAKFNASYLVLANDLSPFIQLIILVMVNKCLMSVTFRSNDFRR